MCFLNDVYGAAGTTQLNWNITRRTTQQQRKTSYSCKRHVGQGRENMHFPPIVRRLSTRFGKKHTRFLKWWQLQFAILVCVFSTWLHLKLQRQHQICFKMPPLILRTKFGSHYAALGMAKDQILEVSLANRLSRLLHNCCNSKYRKAWIWAGTYNIHEVR